MARLFSRQKLEAIRLWTRLETISNERVAKKVFSWSKGLSRAVKKKRERKCIDILVSVGVNDCDDINIISFQEKMCNLDQENWYYINIAQ
jgi:hypothetical protein